MIEVDYSFLFLFLFRSFFTLTEGGPPPRVCRECLTTQVAEFRGEAEAGIEYCGQGDGGFVGGLGGIRFRHYPWSVNLSPASQKGSKFAGGI